MTIEQLALLVAIFGVILAWVYIIENGGDF